MEMYNVLFIINLAILIGITTYNCFKKKKKAIVCNFVFLSFFLAVKLAQVYYVDIRSGLYDFLGEELFYSVKKVLSEILFFGTSIIVGIQILSELLNIIVIVFVAAKAVAIFVKKCSKSVFSLSIESENEETKDRYNTSNNTYLYLILQKLLN